MFSDSKYSNCHLDQEAPVSRLLYKFKRNFMLVGINMSLMLTQYCLKLITWYLSVQSLLSCVCFVVFSWWIVLIISWKCIVAFEALSGMNINAIQRSSHSVQWLNSHTLMSRPCFSTSKNHFSKSVLFMDHEQELRKPEMLQISKIKLYATNVF